jgi:hypothetical protein
MSDRSGQASALTSLIPIAADREDELRAYLRGLPRGLESPLARLPGTHVARWVIIDRLPSDPPEPDSLEAHYLLFTASVDGEIESYLRLLCEQLRPEVKGIWGCCAGFPGADDADAFTSWILDHHLPTSFFVAAYPDATVHEVHNSLAARDQLLRFVLQSASMDPHARLEAFRSEFPSR